MKLFTIALFLTICLVADVLSQAGQCDRSSINRATKEVFPLENRAARRTDQELLSKKDLLFEFAQRGDIRGMRKLLKGPYMRDLEKLKTEVKGDAALANSYKEMERRQEEVVRILGNMTPGNKADEQKASQLACGLTIYKAHLLDKYVVFRRRSAKGGKVPKGKKEPDTSKKPVHQSQPLKPATP